MNTRLITLIVAVWICLVSSSALAQAPAEQVSPAPVIAASPTGTAQAQPNAQAQNMDKMATTVTRMAEMCETMMQKEKAAMPYIAGAAIALGTLIFIALVLLVVLQVQWIIYWTRLLHAQRRKDVAGPA